jgi:asparagine synthase (glutamine-hydrolysing)
VRVVLGGGGGDSVISDGNYYFRDLAVEFKWKKLIEEIRAYSENFNRSTINLFINVFFQLVPQNLKSKILPYNERRPGMDIINKKFANRINAKDYLENIYWDPLNKANTAKTNHYQTLSMDNIYFLEMLNRTTSVFSIESRYPFLDKRLVEFAYAIPTEIKFKNGWYRYIQRIAMENILPKKNQWRRKGSSILPLFDKNLLQLEKDRLNDIIYTNNNLIKEYVDLERIKNIYIKKLNGENIDHASMDMWIVSLLYLWLKKSKISPV